MDCLQSQFKQFSISAVIFEKKKNRVLLSE